MHPRVSVIVPTWNDARYLPRLLESLRNQTWKDFIQAGIVQPDDWKRNHRIYEYHEDGLSRHALEELAEQGFAAHIQGWKNREGVRDFLRLMRSNATGRKVILGNLLRLPKARQMSREARVKASLHLSGESRRPLAGAVRAR